MQEVFADFNPYAPHLFTVPIQRLNHFKVDDVDLKRISEGLMAFLLSIRKYPASIRYGYV